MARHPLPLRARAYLHHVVLKLITLSIGAAYVSRPAARLRDWRDRAPALYPRAVALVAHIYYPDMLPEILLCHSKLPPGSGLVLTAPENRMEQLREATAGLAGVKLLQVENRGRDIAPFLTLLNGGALDGYDVVVKLHTKRSPHLRDGNIRRKLLFIRLAGSRRQTHRILSLFEDASTGMVGWVGSWRRSVLFWMSNQERMVALAAAMHAPPPSVPGFFEGSMFWARPAALSRLRALGLSPEDFEVEQGQLDGGLHHAIERCFTIPVTADGYVVRDIKGRVLLARSPTEMPESAARPSIAVSS